MPSAVVVRLLSTLIAGFSCLTVLLAGLPVSAQDTTIQTKVCNPSNGSTAQLTISQPVNDSVTNQGIVTISGALQDVSQIDIEINGTYSHTVAIATGQTSYTTSSQLLVGTHTITVRGVDMCSFADPSASVVVTYQPDTQPSTGGETPTQPPAGKPTVGEPARPGQTPATPAEDAEWVQNIPLLPEALEIIRDTGRELDFDQLGKDSTWKGFARFILFTLGVILLIGGPWLLARLEKREKFQASVSRYRETGMRTSAVVSHLRRNSWLMRGFGIVLILLTFAI